MKIAIDISQAVFGTGVSVYTLNLVKALSKIDTKNEYILFGGSLRRRKELYSLFNNLSPNFIMKLNLLSPLLADFIGNKVHYLPIELITGRVDLVHTSDWAEPYSVTANKITTVHDIAPFVIPDETNPRILSQYKRKMYWVKRESKKIICPSAQTKNDLVARGFSESIISVIPEALDTNFLSENEDYEQILKKYRLTGKYVLCVGTSPRKNLAKVYEAVSRLPKTIKLSNMVVVGETPQKKLPNVVYLGFVPKEDLPALYKGSAVFVYCSLYEGFGLPLLEAYSQSAPTVASSLPCLREIGEGSTIFVNQHDPVSIAKGIVEAVSEQKYLIKKAHKKLQSYSWENAAKLTLDEYMKI